MLRFDRWCRAGLWGASREYQLVTSYHVAHASIAVLYDARQSCSYFLETRQTISAIYEDARLLQESNSVFILFHVLDPDLAGVSFY